MVKNCQNILKNVGIFRHASGIASPEFFVDVLTLIYYYDIIKLNNL